MHKLQRIIGSCNQMKGDWNKNRNCIPSLMTKEDSASSSFPLPLALLFSPPLLLSPLPNPSFVSSSFPSSSASPPSSPSHQKNSNGNYGDISRTEKSGQQVYHQSLKVNSEVDEQKRKDNPRQSYFTHLFFFTYLMTSCNKVKFVTFIFQFIKSEICLSVQLFIISHHFPNLSIILKPSAF